VNGFMFSPPRSSKGPRDIPAVRRMNPMITVVRNYATFVATEGREKGDAPRTLQRGKNVSDLQMSSDHLRRFGRNSRREVVNARRRCIGDSSIARRLRVFVGSK